MTKLYTLLIVFLLTITASAQTTIKERKAVSILTTQTFYLNGGNRATFSDGKSRVWYPIQLPPNTVEWYYSFTTSNGDDPTDNIKLMSQLTRLMDPSGFTAIAASSLFTPSGTAVCDIYLMDRANADKFIEKVDNWGGTYTYLISGSRQNYKNGSVQVKDKVSGNWCLGFKNPSAMQGISVSLEVVAIVEEVKIKEKTEKESKAEMFGELGWKAYEKGEYDKCLELSKKALEFNPNLGWVHNNIGLVHLIKKDYISAIESYSTVITFFKKETNSKQWFNEAIKDLNNLIKKHGQLEGSKDILDMLITEQNK